VAFFGHWRVCDFLLGHRADAHATLLAFGHRISPAAVERNTSDHGAGWGNGMEWNLLGEYLPASVPRR
jgi:hypothetical protein